MNVGFAQIRGARSKKRVVHSRTKPEKKLGGEEGLKCRGGQGPLIFFFSSFRWLYIGLK